MAFANEGADKLKELPTREIILQVRLRHDIQLDRADELVGTVLDTLVEDLLPEAIADAIWESSFFSAKEKAKLVDIDPEITDVSTVIVDAEPLES